MKNVDAIYNRGQFRKQPEEFRIGAVLSDGMWYSLPKIRKYAKVSEELLNDWIKIHLENGMLVQSQTGAMSFRFPLTSIHKWYQDNNLDLNVQLIDFLFPPRIWDGMTETEGFLAAPSREIGVMSFSCSTLVAKEIEEELRGIARVRECEPGQFKAYCLDSRTAKKVVDEVFSRHDEVNKGKTYSKTSAYRRELVDFTKEFRHGLLMFYKNFGKTRIKPAMDTINIFLPAQEDQDAQVIMWVIDAIEKFNEKDAVPFSGYLDSVLRIWPYNLPNNFLGKELSAFQRMRSRSIKILIAEKNKDKNEITNEEIASEMGWEIDEFNSFEERHRVWISCKHATSLVWAENNEEKMQENYMSKAYGPQSPSDVQLANKISLALVNAALETELFHDAFNLITQIDANDLNTSVIKEVSNSYKQALGNELNVKTRKIEE